MHSNQGRHTNYLSPTAHSHLTISTSVFVSQQLLKISPSLPLIASPPIHQPLDHGCSTIHASNTAAALSAPTLTHRFTHSLAFAVSSLQLSWVGDSSLRGSSQAAIVPSRLDDSCVACPNPTHTCHPLPRPKYGVSSSSVISPVCSTITISLKHFCI